MSGGVPSFVPVVVVGFVVAFLVIAAVAMALSRRRMREMADAAARLGWRFAAGHRAAPTSVLQAASIFRRGRNRRVFNTMTGDLEVAGSTVHAAMGDFAYTVETGTGKSKSSHTEVFSYLVFPCPLADVPDLRIRREHFGDRVLAAVGLDDIDFESAEFSRRFHVSSDDKRFAYDVVHPRMMEFLLDDMPTDFAIHNGVCCLSDGRSTWPPDEFAARAGWCRRFFALWPRQRLDAAHTGGPA